jgi:hypothetical protein
MRAMSADAPQGRRGDHLARTTRRVIAKTSAHDRSAGTNNIQGERYADIYAVASYRRVTARKPLGCM